MEVLNDVVTDDSHAQSDVPIQPLIDSLRWAMRRLQQVVPGSAPVPDDAWPLIEESLATTEVSESERKAPHDSWSRLHPGLNRALEYMGFRNPCWSPRPQANGLPALAYAHGMGLVILHSRNLDQTWLLEGPKGLFYLQQFAVGSRFFSPPHPATTNRRATLRELLKSTLRENQSYLIHAGVATALINLLGLFTSLYSMQVYDRVIPTQGVSTLLVLTAGVGLCVLLELVARFARSSLVNTATERMDCELTQKIFERLLRIRIDQFPQSVGTLSAQVRSYESLRSFASNAALYLLVDTPFALLSLVLVLWIAGPVMALMPLSFLATAIMLSVLARWRILATVKKSYTSSNQKLGLLVEAIDAVESIKAAGAGWQLRGRWAALARNSVQEDRKVREDSETVGYLTATLQQVSYVMLVAMGAYIASTGNELTSGGIIACSILSGRLLGPIAGLPGLMVQWANARIALGSLEHIFSLQQDHHDVVTPLTIERVQGRYELSDVAFAYSSLGRTLTVPALGISPGERIGVVGVIGSGKSTLLRVLAGIYAPQRGRTLLDGLDIQQMDRQMLSRRLGFLPQEVRLISGNLRDNLLLGLPGLADEKIMDCCRRTGLHVLVESHPRGLDLPVFENSGGLSAGQRQQIALTRLILAWPDVWLLDEPTARMDEASEALALQALDEASRSGKTLIVVTHRPAALALVERLVVVSDGAIVLDGPKVWVLEQLQQTRQRVGAAA